MHRKAKRIWILTALLLAGCFQSHVPVVEREDAATPRDARAPRDSRVPDTSDPMDAGCRRIMGGTPNAACPSGSSIPQADELSGACCYRTSNARCPASPQFRFAALMLTTPASLASPIVRGALNFAMDEERFNWLLSVRTAPGSVRVQTGNGRRNLDATFSFYSGDAPPPGDPQRWDPRDESGSLAGEMLSVPPLRRPFTVAILDSSASGVVQFELPLSAFELSRMHMSEGRSCVGTRGLRSYTTMDGEFAAFITVRDAAATMINLPPIHTSLCNFMRGSPGDPGACTTSPTTWAVAPDARCEGSTCTSTCVVGANLGDPGTCNAWRLAGGFAAQGVTIR